MKRDLDLARLILLEQEAGSPPKDLEKYSEAEILYHVAILAEAGLIHAHVLENESGDVCQAVIYRLTWAGHDFLDATADPTLWQRVRERVLKPGVSWTFSVLMEALKVQLLRGFPSLQ